MQVTIIATIMVFIGYFLLLYGGVGFVQDKRFFGTAHPDILAVVPDKKERFKGAHVIGWIIIVISLLLFIGALVLSLWDGAQNDFNFWQFFLRFMIILYAMEIYDIGFFDWVLLCHSNFFPRFYPEVKDIVGPHMFGYNMKDHFIHLLIYIPVSAVLAGIGLLIG